MPSFRCQRIQHPLVLYVLLSLTEPHSALLRQESRRQALPTHNASSDALRIAFFDGATLRGSTWKKGSCVDGLSVYCSVYLYHV
jgi:hypothetical protein